MSSSESDSGGEPPSSGGQQDTTTVDLTQEQVEKLVQLQDLTGIDDTSVCRALLESKGWDLEATAREQFGEGGGPSSSSREAPPPPPPLRPHDEAAGAPPEAVRQRLFGGGGGAGVPAAAAFPPPPPQRRRPPPPPAAAADDGGGGPLAALFSWGFYIVTLPVVWPVRLAYNVFWSLASLVGIAGGGGGGPRSIAAPLSSGLSPIEEVRSFRRSFAASYGDTELHFHDGTYSQALDLAKRELKFLVVYLHSPGHQDTDSFCRQTLASRQFADFLQDKILFGASVETYEGYRVSQAVRVSSYPLLAVIVLRQNRMMIVGRQEGAVDDVDALVQRFNDVVADNEAFVVAARADRAERDMNQAIREEQDAAFQETLRQDQEKDRLKREAEEARRREEAEAEAALRSAQDKRDKIRQAKVDLASKVPPEPDTNTDECARILVKLPSGGRLERRFRRHVDTLEHLFLYVFCHPDSPDDFQITTNFPRRVLPCRPQGFFRSIGVSDDKEEEVGNEEVGGTSGMTLAQAGIGKSEMLFVNDLEA